MKFLGFWIILLLSFEVQSQIVFAPLSSAPFEVGDVVEVYVKDGKDQINATNVAEVFSQVSSEKIILMSSYQDERGLVAKVVIAPSFKDNDLIPVQGNPSIKTIEFQGIQIQKKSPEKKELIYNDVPLIEKVSLKRIILISVFLLALAGAFFILFDFINKQKIKKNKINKAKAWAHRIESAKNLSSCSELWLQRNEMRKDLGMLETELEAFFLSLSPDQFKMINTESLNDKIIQAKNNLLRRLREIYLGI